MGFPQWFGATAADSTFQSAIIVAGVLLVMGIVIAILIVRVRNRRERRMNRNDARAAVYNSKYRVKHAPFHLVCFLVMLMPIDDWFFLSFLFSKGLWQ